MNKIFVFAEEHCVICGAVIPEGRQVCPLCEGAAFTPKKPAGIPATTFLSRLRYWFLEKWPEHRT